MSSSLNNQLGYAGKEELRGLTNDVNDFVNKMKEEAVTLENIEGTIDDIQNNVNSISQTSKDKIDILGRKITNYVNLLKSSAENDVDNTKYFEKLGNYDLSDIQDNNLVKLDAFMAKNSPVEEEIYKKNIINNEDNYILSRGALINVDFHRKAREEDFANIPYGFLEWNKAMESNKDKMIKIRKNANTKAFEFGIKYTQTFSNINPELITIERYFTGKIVITGILYNHDGKSINPKDNIPFSIKGVIYNADYDKSDMLGPKMEFNIDMDEKYIYIWLGKVTPYRLIPVIDKSNNKNQLDLLDLVETNTGKGYVLKNYDNLYVSDTEKLDISKPIGINYSVNFSLYDTTFYTYEKTFEDEEEVNTRLEIVDITYEKGTIDENKKGIFEVKPPVAGYTQLIGYSMSECNIPTLVTPHNTVKEFRNFETKTISDDYIHKLPKRSSLIWEAVEPIEYQIGKMAPQTFRSMRVIVNDPDSDYFYLLVEEDLINGFSKWDSTHYTLPTKLAGNLKHNTSTLAGLTYLTGSGFLGTTFGKYKGKRCFITGLIGNTDHLFLFTDFDTRNDINVGKANNFTYKKITPPTKIGEYKTSGFLASPTQIFANYNVVHGLWYDNYTGYWYLMIRTNVNWNWFRTKDFENYEVIDACTDKNAKALGLTNSSDLYSYNTRFNTDGNGRFIMMGNKDKSSYWYMVFDNGDFDNPIKCDWIKDTAIQNTESVNAFNLFTTKNGIWYAFIHGEKTGAGDHGLYLYSNDNGLTWTKKNVINNSQSYHIALHSDSNVWVSHLWRVGDYAGYRPVGTTTAANANHASVHSGPYKFPQDRERNNVMLPFPVYRRDGYFGEFYYEGTSWRMGRANKMADTNRNQIWHNYTASNNGTTFNHHHNNFIYDEVNDSYWLSAGTNGITNWDYRHHYHMFIPNRIYRVNKMDYTMTCVSNLWVDGFFTYATAGLDSSSKNAKTRRTNISETDNALYSYDYSGIYNYATTACLSTIYTSYDKNTKTLYVEINGHVKRIKENEYSLIDSSSTMSSTNKMDRNIYSEECDMYFYGTNNIVYACTHTQDAPHRKIIELMPKHNTSDGYNKIINNTTESLGNGHYIDGVLYVMGRRGVFIFKNVDIYASLGTGNTINGYREEDLEIIPYPWINEINEISARETDNTVPNSRWYDEAYNDPNNFNTIYIKEANKIISFISVGNYINDKSLLMKYDNHGEYDRKYWKGILVFDIPTKTFTFTTEAFQEPGDGNDIDFIDYYNNGAIQVCDYKTYINKDKEGWYITSAKTGNIYSVSENWDKFTKRESTNIMTQIVYNNRRKSYIVFNGTTPAEYIENRYKRPQIREIPLVTVDYNIKPENIDKIKQDVINELDKHCKFNNYNNVFFELMIVTKPYEADKDHYLIFKEHGCYNSGNNTDRKNIITRYFIKDRQASIVREFYTNTGSRFDTHERESYNAFNLNTGLNIRYYIPGLERLKYVQNISQPLEDLENSLLKMPTTITLTIYPTTGTAYDFTYSIARQNSDSNNMGLKVYTAEVTKMVNSNN